MFGLSLPNLSSGTRSTFKLALRFFWGETRGLLFCYLFASGPCRPTIISSPFPPPTNTGRFATQKSTISLRDFGGVTVTLKSPSIGSKDPSYVPNKLETWVAGFMSPPGSSACDRWPFSCFIGDPFSGEAADSPSFGWSTCHLLEEAGMGNLCNESCYK